MYSISREYRFEAAHRIEGHPKCSRLHGHSYQVIVTIRSETLPEDGMLVDYGKLDALVKPLIDEMDHRYIVSQSNHKCGDPYEAAALKRGDVFPLNAPASTGEYIAEFLWRAILHVLQGSVYTCTRDELTVMVSETPKSTASYGDAL